MKFLDEALARKKKGVMKIEIIINGAKNAPDEEANAEKALADEEESDELKPELDSEEQSEESSLAEIAGEEIPQGRQPMSLRERAKAKMHEMIKAKKK